MRAAAAAAEVEAEAEAEAAAEEEELLLSCISRDVAAPAAPAR